MIVTICYIPKSIESVFLLVQCNTSLSKNFIAHSITVVRVIGWIWGKTGLSATIWLSMHTKSVVEQGFFHQFAFANKVLKTFVEFRICWKHSKFERCWFELCHISNRNSWSWAGIDVLFFLIKSRHWDIFSAKVWMLLQKPITRLMTNISCGLPA